MHSHIRLFVSNQSMLIIIHEVFPYSFLGGGPAVVVVVVGSIGITIGTSLLHTMKEMRQEKMDFEFILRNVL
jgi:hypothetical protein